MEGSATSTAVVDGSLYYILAFSGLLFFVIIFAMLYFLVRYRASRNPVPQELKGNAWVEVVWIVVPTLIALSMFAYGLTGFRFLRTAPADSLVVKVHASQWSWLFEYGNGKKSTDLIVPLGKNIRCDLYSADVIHSFYAPAFRIQEDILPGLKTFVWFNANTPGSSYLFCAQYCGLRHSNMIAKIIAVPADQFTDWMNGKKMDFSGSATANMPPGQALLYERGCVSCHSFDGATMMGPTFKGLVNSSIMVSSSGSAHTIVADTNYIRESIINPGADIVDGFPNTMPSSKSTMTEEDLHNICEYLKTIK